MASSHGKHRKTKNTNRNLARVALTGAVMAAPFALTVPANAADESTWDAVAECESGGDWQISTGNGYEGGLQFDSSTWSGYGGDEYAASASEATREQQIAVAERVLEAQGPSAWPSCGPEAGLSSSGEAENQDVEAGGEAATESEEAAEPVEEESAPVEEETAPAEEQEGADLQMQSEAAPMAGDYTVQEGDTLSAIAEQFGVNWEAVFEQNGQTINDPHMIFPGQQLSVN